MTAIENLLLQVKHRVNNVGTGIGGGAALPEDSGRACDFARPPVTGTSQGFYRMLAEGAPSSCSRRQLSELKLKVEPNPP